MKNVILVNEIESRMIENGLNKTIICCNSKGYEVFRFHYFRDKIVSAIIRAGKKFIVNTVNGTQLSITEL